MTDTRTTMKGREDRADEQEVEPRGPAVRPRVDLYESDEAFLLLADLPGADEASTELVLERQTLTLRARGRNDLPEGVRPLRTEFAIGRFERSFELGREIDGENISATFQNGLLRVTLPKSTRGKRSIEIQKS